MDTVASRRLPGIGELYPGEFIGLFIFPVLLTFSFSFAELDCSQTLPQFQPCVSLRDFHDLVIIHGILKFNILCAYI